MPTPGPDDETATCCYDGTIECVRGGCNRIAELEQECNKLALQLTKALNQRDEARALAEKYGPTVGDPVYPWRRWEED